MNGATQLAAFAGAGLEIEYMIVNRDSLDIQPLAAELLHRAAGAPATEVTRGDMVWSNELMLHQIEVKNPRPVATLQGLPAAFHAEVCAINALLAKMGACLMPGAMHPWMNPRTEARLWSGENAAIYTAFDQIFDCRRHSWANVQSAHLNLPFADDAQFARLHAAIRMALPILPALAASSPWADARESGHMDYRLACYLTHQAQVPASMGACIPEPSASQADYRQHVHAPMLQQIAAFDDLLGAQAGALSEEWLDVRAAAPRFARHAIEIRVLDTQECALADCAIAAAVTALVKCLYDSPKLMPLPTADLLPIFEACIRDGDQAMIRDSAYLRQLGLERCACRAGDAWWRLIYRFARRAQLDAMWLPPLQHITQYGTLARRISELVNGKATRLAAVYRELCQCLARNRMLLDPAAKP